MKKLVIISVLVIAGIGAYLYFSRNTAPIDVVNVPAASHKNISYEIDGEDIKLTNGSYEAEPAPGSDERMTTEYFGNEARGDFNADGREDIAFLLFQSGAGTGTFFYIAAALKTADGYQGTNAVFLGDRIAPQTTEFRDGKILVNYADRKPDEPLSAEPSVGVSKYFKVSGSRLIESAPGE